MSLTDPPKNAAAVLKLAKEKDVKVVDFKFVDMLGTWQHFSTPLAELTEDVFEDGLGFDGSSIRGWRAINSSDMMVVPDPTTAVIDPFGRRTTLSLLCNIHDPITREAYERDPRNIARKAEAFLKKTGLADVCNVGPEPEFFIFDDVRFDLGSNHGSYSVDSNEAGWNSGREEFPNLGYKIRSKEGYFPVPPNDSHADIRQEICEVLEEVGLQVERDRLPLRCAHALRRQDHVAQVRDQERRSQERQDGHVHAQAGRRRQRQRHALPHVALEKREAAVRR